VWPLLVGLLRGSRHDLNCGELWGQECGRCWPIERCWLTLFGGILFYAYLYPLPYANQMARELPVLLVDED
jgi:hypothetical protein